MEEESTYDRIVRENRPKALQVIKMFQPKVDTVEAKMIALWLEDSLIVQIARQRLRNSNL